MPRYFITPLKFAVLTLVLTSVLSVVCVSITERNGEIISASSAGTLSFNRYQAGFFCRERGWEFCANWSYTQSRIA